MSEVDGTRTEVDVSAYGELGIITAEPSYSMEMKQVMVNYGQIANKDTHQS